VRIEKVLPFKAKTENIIHIGQDLQDEQDILPFLKKGKKYHPLFEGDNENKRGCFIIKFSLSLPCTRYCPFALSSGKSENKIRKILLILSEKEGSECGPFQGPSPYHLFYRWS